MTTLKTITETVDNSTGEIVTVSKSFRIKNTNTEKFYMTFLDHMGPLLGIKSITERKVLDSLCSIAEFNTGKVSLTPSKRQEMCILLEISSQTFSNCLGSLNKCKLITGKSGDYEINPMVFWKGTTDARAKLLKDKGMEIIFKYGGQEDGE